jgi:AcrR family transcriptional regulator
MLDNRSVPSSKPSRSPQPDMPTTPLGLRERKKVRTRAALQRHALQLFTEKGYRDTTIEQIAEAAEVSPSTFFRYFATKEDTVLGDYFDARVIGFFREAPAQMSPVQAMKYAMQQMTESMSPEELELELKRNQLIATVPELQRGMVEEMLRPMRLLAAALADRLGTVPDDPFCTAYAGALIGGLVAISGHDGSETIQDLGRIVHGADILDQVLRTPPRRTSARNSTSEGTAETAQV